LSQDIKPTQAMLRRTFMLSSLSSNVTFAESRIEAILKQYATSAY